MCILEYTDLLGTGRPSSMAAHSEIVDDDRKAMKSGRVDICGEFYTTFPFIFPFISHCSRFFAMVPKPQDLRIGIYIYVYIILGFLSVVR